MLQRIQTAAICIPRSRRAQAGSCTLGVQTLSFSQDVQSRRHSSYEGPVRTYTKKATPDVNKGHCILGSSNEGAQRVASQAYLYAHIGAVLCRRGKGGRAEIAAGMVECGTIGVGRDR